MTPSGLLTSLVRHAPTAVQAVRRTVVARTRTGWVAVRRTWRQSLQLRIVTITLCVSTLLVGTFGILVASMITKGLLQTETATAERKVRDGAIVAAQQMKGSDDADPNRGGVTGVLTQLTDRPEQGGQRFTVAMVPKMGEPLITAKYWPDLDVRPAITDELRREVQTSREVAHQIVTRDLDGDGPQRYLVYGVPVETVSGTVELYYVFPLADTVAMANLVATTVSVTGIALVVLLALIAAIVTRLVVRPVRLAARTAQRLSAGLLDQRMTVRGEDDLALLAGSFNHMAENLQRQIVRLEEMSRLQRRFTSDVSHELRTPLTTVRMAADLLFSERADFDPVVARSAELLQLELDRFEALLTDLLEISRFDAGFAMLDAEPTDLVPIVRSVTGGLGAVADRAGVAFDLDLPDGPVIAEVDVRRIERVLRNLIGNAVDHANGQPVRVTLRANDTAVAVAVRDHGVGLRSDEDKLVFNRFWRADPSRARQTGGTGLGLSISLEDARLHGGWLEAWGEPGRGAQFRLTLPARAGDRLVASPITLIPDDVAEPAESVPPAPEAVAALTPVLPSLRRASHG